MTAGVCGVVLKEEGILRGDSDGLVGSALDPAAEENVLFRPRFLKLQSVSF